jgi:hypothetical protein
LLRWDLVNFACLKLQSSPSCLSNSQNYWHEPQASVSLKFCLLLLLLLCSTYGIWTQGFVLTRQVLYHLSYVSIPSLKFLLWKISKQKEKELYNKSTSPSHSSNNDQPWPVLFCPHTPPHSSKLSWEVLGPCPFICSILVSL